MAQPRSRFRATPAIVIGLLLFVIALGAAGCDLSTADASQRGRDKAGAAAKPAGDKDRPGQGKPDKPGKPDKGDEPGDKPKPDPRRERTYLVAYVVDGDTVHLGNGESVRLVGIDAPEAGTCGYERATANLARLVEGRHVRLGMSDENRDRYGRLLRYVDVGTMDAGLRLIKNGVAIARYDSRDGYGFHPRELRYIAADKAHRDLGCPAPQPKPQPLMGGGGGGCGGYAPCIPSYPPDLDCPDVNGPVTVTGSDPHGLDGDGDGVACEWG